MEAFHQNPAQINAQELAQDLYERGVLISVKLLGFAVCKTKRGNGTRVIAIVDASGLPLAVNAKSASSHEVKLGEGNCRQRSAERGPGRLIDDKAYDSTILLTN